MATKGSSGHHAALDDFETTFVTDEATLRDAEWGGMRVGVESYSEDFDDAHLLVGLPDDLCQCPHWGYLRSGRMTVRYPDHEEIVGAGEVYYMSPGHSILVDAGTELIEFSPVEEFQKTMAVAELNLAKLESTGAETP